MSVKGDVRLENDQYRLLVEGVGDAAIYLLDLEGKVQTWSGAAQRIKGYAAEEVIGRDFSVFFPAAAVADGAPARALREARERGIAKSEGWRIRRDGSRFWASAVVEALYNENGAVIGFAKLTRDTTEQSYKAEQHRIVAEASPNGMLVADERGTITLANARAERLFGYRAGALIGRDIADALAGPTFDIAKLFATWRMYYRGAELSQYCGQYELAATRHDGTTFPAQVSFNVSPTSRGPHVVASVIDVTERRRAEHVLVETNRLMALVEEMAHTAHWRIDLRTSDVTWSTELLKIFGFASPPALADVYAAYDSSVNVEHIVAQASVDGKPFTYESRIRRTDGALRDVRVSGRAELDGNGRPVALFGFLSDISEQRQIEQALRSTNRLMSMAEEMAHVGHWHIDLGSSETTWSEELYRILGYSKGDRPSLQQDLDAYGDRAAEIGAIIRKAKTDGLPFGYEARRTRPDGAVRDVRVAGRGERAANGTLHGLFGIVHDVTDLRDAERDRAWSTRFQRAVMPVRLPRVTGCRFDAVYEPGLADAQVGGDWYDALRLNDGRVLVSIGDVAGSGLEAAVVVGVARQVMRGVAQLHADPVLILDAADRSLRDEYPGVYVSAWVGLVDLVEGTITYASAGHPPALLVSHGGSVRELHDPTTMLIGLREGHRARATTVPISAGGDTLVLYTDGITEAGRDILDGYRRVGEAASLLAAAPANTSAEDFRRYVNPEGSQDDVAVLITRIDVAQAEQHLQRWRFHARDGAAAGRVRGQLRTALEGMGFDSDDCANAELIFGELIGNVVRHANGPADVDAALDYGGPSVILHVMDRGRGFAYTSQLPPEPFAESGRGLFLISALALDFSVTARAGGGSHARAVLAGRPLPQRAQRRERAFAT